MDAEWNKIRAGDLHQFRTLVEGAFPVGSARALMLSGFLALETRLPPHLFVFDRIVCRVSCMLVACISGLEDSKDLDQVREMIEPKWKTCAQGIVWKDGSYVVRFSPNDCREQRVGMGSLP
eukprot:2929430-Amphidinium_carterae.1